VEPRHYGVEHQANVRPGSRLKWPPLHAAVLLAPRYSLNSYKIKIRVRQAARSDISRVPRCVTKRAHPPQQENLLSTSAGNGGHPLQVLPAAHECPSVLLCVGANSADTRRLLLSQCAKRGAMKPVTNLIRSACRAAPVLWNKRCRCVQRRWRARQGLLHQEAEWQRLVHRVYQREQPPIGYFPTWTFPQNDPVEF